MKTRKNTKSNPSSSNRGADIVVVALSLLIVFFSSYLFVQSLNRTFSRSDKTPVATVTFKYKAVQRRFLDRAVWDRPQQHSPVYNGDTIRTAPSAEATIYFTDRNIVELGSSTMIQVFVQNEESQIHLDTGLVSVETSGDSDMLISSGNTTAKLSRGSTFRADKNNAGALQFVVEKGSASVSGADGTEQAQVLTEGAVMQAGSELPLVMISPGKSVKLLDQSARGVDVPFKWHSSLPAGEALVLETSPLGTFAEETQQYPVTGLTEYTLTGQSRSFYWRLYASGTGPLDSSAVSGKVSVIAAPSPVLLEPAVEAKYTYSELLPTVRFLWEGNTLAASYLLEVADNPELNNPQFSRFVNTQSVSLSRFGEGTWYWRVTPRYLIGAKNEAEPSKVGFFHIERIAAASETATKVFFPQTVAETARGKEMTFAWKKLSETKSYRIKVAKDVQMRDVVVDTVVDANSFKLSDAAALLPNGDYYWTVAGINSTGVEMAATLPVKFKTINSDFSLRSIFPPDGYIIADTLCPDIRFTWKTNIEEEKRFQVSASADFATLTIDTKTTGNGLEGIRLPEGTWYWRVVADSAGGVVRTAANRMEIAPPLEKPRLFDIGSTVVVFPEGKNVFAWSSVDGADHYKVRIIRVGYEDTPLYENLFITGTRIELPLQHVKDGNFRISIQGFAAASVRSTRRYGLAIDHDFTLKQVRPVELVYPADGASIKGLDAALHPSSFKWSSDVPPASSRLILRKNGVAKPVFQVSNPQYEVKAPPLEAGKYTWEVKASVLEGFDISSTKPFTFTVLKIPPLPAASFREPTANAVLNAAFFKSNRSIDFQWSKVPDATHYRFTLRNAAGRAIFTAELQAEAAQQPALNFTEITRLSRGVFTAEVVAQRRLRNGKVFQGGTVARLPFQIDLPKSRAVTTDETGVLYGK